MTSSETEYIYIHIYILHIHTEGKKYCFIKSAVAENSECSAYFWL